MGSAAVFAAAGRCAKLPQPVEFGSFVMAQGLTARVVGIAGADPLFARIRQEAEEAMRREPELALFLVRERSQPRYARRGGVASRRVTSRSSRSSRRADPPDLRRSDRSRPLDRRGVPRRYHGGRRSRSRVLENDRAVALFQRLPGAAGLSVVPLALEGGQARFRTEPAEPRIGDVRRRHQSGRAHRQRACFSITQPAS